MRFQVGILVFNDVEVLDVAGPFEVFSVSKQIHQQPFFDVCTIGITTNAIKAINGLQIIPDYSIENHPALNILILSGGQGTNQAILDDDLLVWIKNIYPSLTYLLSICSGARFLAKLGFLSNKQYCTHHLVYDNIQQIDASAIPLKNTRFCAVTPNIYSSGGISAGIDLSFYIIAQLTNEAVAKEIATYMEYPIHLSE